MPYYKKGQNDRVVKLVPKALYRKLNKDQKEEVRRAGAEAYRCFGSRFFDLKRLNKDEYAVPLGEAYKLYKTVKRKVAKLSFQDVPEAEKNNFFNNLYKAKADIKQRLGFVASSWLPPADKQQAELNFDNKMDHFRALNANKYNKYNDIKTATQMFSANDKSYFGTQEYGNYAESNRQKILEGMKTRAQRAKDIRSQYAIPRAYHKGVQLNGG